MGRVDLGCIRDDAANKGLWYEGSNLGRIDSGFGFTEGDGPCRRSDGSFREAFQEASIAWGDWQYAYPRTMVWFLFGERDDTPAVGQGLTYHARLVERGSPLVRLDYVSGTGHGVQDTRAGAELIRDILLNECRPR